MTTFCCIFYPLGDLRWLMLEMNSQGFWACKSPCCMSITATTSMTLNKYWFDMKWHWPSESTTLTLHGNISGKGIRLSLNDSYSFHTDWPCVLLGFYCCRLNHMCNCGSMVFTVTEWTMYLIVGAFLLIYFLLWELVWQLMSLFQLQVERDLHIFHFIICWHCISVECLVFNTKFVLPDIALKNANLSENCFLCEMITVVLVGVSIFY